MSSSSASAPGTSSDDDIFTKHVDFEKADAKASAVIGASAKVATSSHSDTIRTESEALPRLSVAAVEGAASRAVTVRSSARSVTDDIEPQYPLTVSLPRSLSTESECRNSFANSPCRRRRRPRRQRCGVDSGPPHVKGMRESGAAQETAMERYSRGEVQSASPPESESCRSPPVVQGMARRRHRFFRHPKSTGDLGTVTVPPAAPPLPLENALNARLLSDEAYLDMFHIPSLMAKLSLSLMAAKPLDPRIFARDWLVDRLVQEEEQAREHPKNCDGSTAVPCESAAHRPCHRWRVNDLSSLGESVDGRRHHRTAVSHDWGSLLSEGSSLPVACRRTFSPEEPQRTSRTLLSSYGPGDDVQVSATHAHSKETPLTCSADTVPVRCQEAVPAAVLLDAPLGSPRSRKRADVSRPNRNQGREKRKGPRIRKSDMMPLNPTRRMGHRESVGNRMQKAALSSDAEAQRSTSGDTVGTGRHRNALKDTVAPSAVGEVSSKRTCSTLQFTRDDDICTLPSTHSITSAHSQPTAWHSPNSDDSDTPLPRKSTAVGSLFPSSKEDQLSKATQPGVKGEEMSDATDGSARLSRDPIEPEATHVWTIEESVAASSKSEGSARSLTRPASPPSEKLEIVMEKMGTVASADDEKCQHPERSSHSDTAVVTSCAAVSSPKSKMAVAGIGSGGGTTSKNDDDIHAGAPPSCEEALGSNDNAAEEERDDNVSFALFSPILGVDSATKEVVDFRTGSNPPSVAASVGGGVGLAPSFSATAANTSVTASPAGSGPSIFTTRSTHPAYGVFPIPTLAAVAGGGGGAAGGLTNTSFGRRGFTMSNAARRGNNGVAMSGIASTGADPTSAVTVAALDGALLASPFITPHSPMASTSTDGVAGSASVPTRGDFPKLSIHETSTSVNAGLLTTSVHRSGTDERVPTSKQGYLKAEGEALGVPSSLKKEGVLEASPPTTSPSLQSESVRRLQSLLGQLPSNRYAAAIVFMEGLLATSEGDGTSSYSLDADSMRMVATASGAAYGSHALLSFKPPVDSGTIGKLGASRNGSGSLTLTQDLERQCSMPLRKISTTGHSPLVPQHSRINTPESLAAVSSAAASGACVEELSKVRMPSTASASVEALVRDALSQSVLQTLSPSHAGVSSSAPALSLSSGIPTAHRGKSASQPRESIPFEREEKLSMTLPINAPRPRHNPQEEGSLFAPSGDSVREGAYAASQARPLKRATSLRSSPPESGCQDLGRPPPTPHVTPEEEPDRTSASIPGARRPGNGQMRGSGDDTVFEGTHATLNTRHDDTGDQARSDEKNIESRRLNSIHSSQCALATSSATMGTTTAFRAAEALLHGGIESPDSSRSSGSCQSLQLPTTAGTSGAITLSADSFRVFGSAPQMSSERPRRRSRHLQFQSANVLSADQQTDQERSPSSGEENRRESHAASSAAASVRKKEGSPRRSQHSGSKVKVLRLRSQARSDDMHESVWKCFTGSAPAAASAYVSRRCGNARTAKEKSASPQEKSALPLWESSKSGDSTKLSAKGGKSYGKQLPSLAIGESTSGLCSGDQSNLEIGAPSDAVDGVAAPHHDDNQTSSRNKYRDPELLMSPPVPPAYHARAWNDRGAFSSSPDISLPTSPNSFVSIEEVASPTNSASTHPPLTAAAMGTESEAPLFGASVANTANTTPVTLNISTSSPPLSEQNLMISSVAVAFSTFLFQEDAIAAEELDFVRESLAHYDAFAALDETQLEMLLRTMSRVELQRGAVIAQEGNEALEELILIVSGRLAISRKGIVKRTLVKGYFCGVMDLSYRGERSLVTITAAAPRVVLYKLRKADYQRLLLHERDARRYLLLHYLNTCEFFKGLSANTKTRLADALRVCRLHKGSKLTEQGAPVQWMYLLISGNVRMTHNSASEPVDAQAESPRLKRSAVTEGDLLHAADRGSPQSHTRLLLRRDTVMEAPRSVSPVSPGWVAASMVRQGSIINAASPSVAISPMQTSLAHPSSPVALMRSTFPSSVDTSTGVRKLLELAEDAATSAEAHHCSTPLISGVSCDFDGTLAAPPKPLSIQEAFLRTTTAATPLDATLLRTRGESVNFSADERALFMRFPASCRHRSRPRLGSVPIGTRNISHSASSRKDSLDALGHSPHSPTLMTKSVKQRAAAPFEASSMDHSPLARGKSARLATSTRTNTGSDGEAVAKADDVGPVEGTRDVHSPPPALVVDRTKGQLVGEPELIFKVNGVFTAVATTPVLAARISRLHFEAVMAPTVIEGMKRDILADSRYYDFVAAVPEGQAKAVRRIQHCLRTDPLRRRRSLFVRQSQRTERRMTCAVEGTRRGSVGVDGRKRHQTNRLAHTITTAGFLPHQESHGSAGSNNGSTRSRSNSCGYTDGTLLSRAHKSHTVRRPTAFGISHDEALSIDGGGGSLPAGSETVSSTHKYYSSDPPPHLGARVAYRNSERRGSSSTDPPLPTSHASQHGAVSKVNGISPMNLPMADPIMVPPTSGLKDSSSSFTELGSEPKNGAGCRRASQGGSNVSSRTNGSHSGHARVRRLRSTIQPMAAGGHSGSTRGTSTTVSFPKQFSTRGELVFSGSRNVYRFSMDAVSANETIIIAVVADGTIIRWNSVAQQVTGYAPFETIGKSIFDFVAAGEGRQLMGDALAAAAQHAGRWEQYSLQGLHEQRVYPFCQNTGIYEVGLDLSVIPSNQAETAEVLLLVGRESKYRATSAYAAEVTRWLEGSLKPQLLQFQRRMDLVEAHGWQVTNEDTLQIRGNLDACVSMVEQFTKFSMLNMEAVSQSWRPTRLPALLRHFAVEAVKYARERQHNYYCNIDLVEPRTDIFLDTPQVLTILRLLLGDALESPNTDADGHAVEVHAELRVTIVGPQETNLVPLTVGSATGRAGGNDLKLYSGCTSGPCASANVASLTPTEAPGGRAADGPRSTTASDSFPYPPDQPSSPATRHTVEKTSSNQGSDSLTVTPLGASGGAAQVGSPTSGTAGPAAISTASSTTCMRPQATASTTTTSASINFTASLRRIRFEVRDDGPSIPALSDLQKVDSGPAAAQPTHDIQVTEDGAAVESSSPKPLGSPKVDFTFPKQHEGADGESDADGKAAAGASITEVRRGRVFGQVQKILESIGGVMYGFTRPEVPGNVVRVELPLLPVPGVSDDGGEDETVGGGAAGINGGPPASNTMRTFTVIVADSNRLQQQQMCRVLWARQHAVVPVTSFREVVRQLEMKTADILLIDPIHLDITSEDYESLLGSDPFDSIRDLSYRQALVVMASDFSDWRVQKLLQRHAVVELPKVGSGALIHIAMQEAEQLVAEMREEEERLELIRRTFTNSSVERHRVGKRIGKGAFGDVFEAEDTLTGGKMAMKQMRLQDGLMADEVVQEILAMTALKHENIIQYFYCEKESDTVLRLYMELAPAGTLRDKIRELPGVPLPFDEIVHHLSCICHGLAYIHEQRYVHCDLKTANLLLGTRNRTKIGDFGSAKRLASTQLLYVMAGTPQYMAPEVLTADSEQRIGYDYKADIWSLGCVVLEMATGSPPFAHLECAQGMGIVKYLTELTESPDLSPLFSGSPLVYEFVRSCLAVNPRNRPTASELLHFDLLQGAVASQRAERLLQRAEKLHKIYMYAAMRADGGTVGKTMAAADRRCRGASRKEWEGGNGDDGVQHHYFDDSTMPFSSDSEYLSGDDDYNDSYYQNYDDDDEEEEDEEMSEYTSGSLEEGEEEEEK